MKNHLSLALRLNKDIRGQGIVEYVLIISLVSILLVGGLQAFQGGLSGLLMTAVAVL